MADLITSIDIRGRKWTVKYGPFAPGRGDVWHIIDPDGTRVAFFETAQMMACHFAMLYAELERMLKGEHKDGACCRTQERNAGPATDKGAAP